MANHDSNPMDPIFCAAQDDLPVTERPFATLAAKHGLREDVLLDALREWARSGLIRRYGALVSHLKLGYACNAMVVWQVPPEQVDLVGQLFARDPDVTHCYARPPAPGFPYNLYTMIHSRSEDECRRKAENLSRAADAPVYELLVSTREFKKDSPRYATLRSVETPEGR